MISAVEALQRSREVRKLNQEKSKKELQELVAKEMQNVELEIEEAIQRGDVEFRYIFLDRIQAVRLRVIMELEKKHYIITILENTSSIIVNFDIETI